MSEEKPIIVEIFNEVYDFRIPGYVDVRTLTFLELRELFNQYLIYDAYRMRILDEIKKFTNLGI